MYIIYETYTDETRNMKEEQFNTKIIGLYEEKEIAIQKLNEYLEHIKLDYSKNEWYISPYEKRLSKKINKNFIKVYQVFNEFVGNCEEVYYVILEKIEVR